MKPACGACGRVHDSSWTRAVGRFNPTGAIGYVADYSGSPVRARRLDAELDKCRSVSSSE